MSGQRVVIEGQSEVQRALDRVADFDVEKASGEAVNALLPAVRAGTNVDSGRMAAAWGMQEGSFVNEVPYAVPQEFGWTYGEGAHATLRAFADHESEVLKAYEKEIESAAKQAGFDP